MNPANRSRFVYVTYIGTTPAKHCKALTDPQLIRQYGSTRPRVRLEEGLIVESEA